MYIIYNHKLFRKGHIGWLMKSKTDPRYYIIIKYIQNIVKHMQKLYGLLVTKCLYYFIIWNQTLKLIWCVIASWYMSYQSNFDSTASIKFSQSWITNLETCTDKWIHKCLPFSSCYKIMKNRWQPPCHEK